MHYYLDVLRKYAVFGGRASRAEYWWFVLVNVLVVVGLGILQALVTEGNSSAAMGISMVSSLYSLVLLIPSLAVGVRRLHDTSRSGWWMFISLVPFIGSIVLLVFMIQDSAPNANQYGPNPKSAKGATPTPAAAN